MIELMIEIIGYIAMAALVGFLLGFLTWGWGQRDRISAARAEGARGARTSVDGDTALRDRLQVAADARTRLEAEIDRLTERLAAAELAAGLGAADAGAPDDPVDAPDPAGTPDAAGNTDAAGTPDADTADAAGAGHRPAPDAVAEVPADAPAGAPAEPAAEPPVVAPPVAGERPAQPRTTARAPGARRLAAGDVGPSARQRTGPAEGVEQGAAPGGTDEGREAGAPEAAATPPPTAAHGEAKGRTDEEQREARRKTARAARRPLASGSPDVTLRQQIMAGPGAPGPTPGGADADAAGAADMPRPSAFTLRRQRGSAAEGPPVADDQAPPSDGGPAPSGMPQPSSFALRRQRLTRPDEPPVVEGPVPPADDEPIPPDASGSSAFATRRQRIMRPDQPPVFDGQVPPADDVATSPDMPRASAFMLRRQRLTRPEDPPVADGQVVPADDEAGSPDMQRASVTTSALREGADAGEGPVNDEATLAEKTSEAGKAPKDREVAAGGQDPTPDKDATADKASAGADKPDARDDGESTTPSPPLSSKAAPGVTAPDRAAGTDGARGTDGATGPDGTGAPAREGGADGEPPAAAVEASPERATGAGAGAPEAQPRPAAVAPASLLAERPAEIDNLRRIRGVGRVIERILNDNGIWLYGQIAELTPSGTAWLADVLDMPYDRLERERWSEQARSLQSEKHGGGEDGPPG